MTPIDAMDLTLTVLFFITGISLYKLYKQDFDILHLWLAMFFVVDSLGFTSFDVVDIGINKTIYDMMQMSFSYFVTLCILFIITSRLLGKRMMNRGEYKGHEKRKKARV